MMNPLSLIPSWVWAAAVATLTATSCKLTIDLGAVKLELEKTKLAYSEERNTALNKFAQAQAEVREVETALTNVIHSEREAADARQNAIARQRDELSARLRTYQADRARAAAAPVPGAPATVEEVAARSAGALVLGSFGQEDVDEAARGDLIRVELQACYRSYDEARTRLEKLNGADDGQGKD